MTIEWTEDQVFFFFFFLVLINRYLDNAGLTCLFLDEIFFWKFDILNQIFSDGMETYG